MPLLVRIDAHDLVAEVAVLAADVGVGVVDVVVGVLPRLGGRRGVPVPGRGVDLGVVHPVPLAVHDVVADLHVLQDLGQREHRGPGDPGRPVARGEQQHAAEHHEPAVHLDHAHDVAAVAVAELGEDLVVDGVELPAELLDLLVASGARAGFRSSLGIGFLAGRGHRAISTGPSGALTQVRTISPLAARTPRRCAGRAPAASTAARRRCGRCPSGSRRAAWRPPPRRRRGSAACRRSRPRRRCRGSGSCRPRRARRRPGR